VDIARQVRPGIAEIEPYVPGLTDDELRRLYGVKRIVKLNANENALGPSPLAIRAIQEELSTLHHYPDGGSELLRHAIAEYHQLTVDHVLVGNGSDDIIKLLSETFLEPGDEIVVPSPSFSQYAFGAAIMRAKVVQAPLDSHFQYDVEAIARAVTDRTKLVYLCSPNNPTGTILTQAQAEWLRSALPSHVAVVLDLAYNDYSTNPLRVCESPALLADPRVVVLHTFSKLYGLAGLRVGYGLAHPELWSYVNRVREPFNVNRLAQRAAAAALADEGHRRASQAHAMRSKAFYEAELPALGMDVVPSEGNFVLVRTGNGVKTMEELMKLGIMVRAGFRGIEEYVRITYGTDEENEICLEALRTVGARSSAV
jgi:histidinol-phosphate aminotransferase